MNMEIDKRKGIALPDDVQEQSTTRCWNNKIVETQGINKFMGDAIRADKNFGNGHKKEEH